MPYYNRGGYGGYSSSLPSAGPNVKRFLVGSYSSLSDGGTGNIAINVPIDAAAGRMIQIWSIEVEVEVASTIVNTWLAVDGKYLDIIVARTAGTAVRKINDPDVIAKWHWNVELATSGLVVVNTVFEKDLYPAVPLMNNQLHITVTNNTGATLNIYAKVWYTDLFVNMAQSIALLQSQVI